MGAALSITNSTDDPIDIEYEIKGEKVFKILEPGQTEKEKDLSVGKEVTIKVSTEKSGVCSIEHTIHAAYDASVTRKWKVVIEDGKLVVKRHGMDLGQ